MNTHNIPGQYKKENYQHYPKDTIMSAAIEFFVRDSITSS